MIGRLKPIHNVLNSTDRAFYKAHSCGLCITTKKIYGVRATLGHSSEMVFVSIILEGISDCPYEEHKARCPVLPLIGRSIVAGPHQHKCAVAAGVLASLQLDLKDAREDKERKLKQFLCKSLAKMEGGIPVDSAALSPVVLAKLRNLSRDGVAEVVAGVVGSVFHLAGHDDEIIEVGCEIGHSMGRLMNYSDAVDDYFKDIKAGHTNILWPIQIDNLDWIEDLLHGELDKIGTLLQRLPLNRNTKLLDSLVNVHARARVNVSLEKFKSSIDNYQAFAGTKSKTLLSN